MNNMKKKILNVLLYTVLICLSLFFLLPILYVFYNSLLPYRYVQTWSPVNVWTMDNFRELFTKYPILKWYWNTFASTAIVVAGNLIFPTMAGYALAKLRFPGKKIIFGALLISMMVPFQLIMIQMYIQLAKLNMHNTIWAITLPFMSQTMFLFMARQFFFAVPGELLEAARIDGLGHAGVFARIVCPISKPLFASIAILNFTGTWNSYMVPATFINKVDKFTLVVGLQTVNMTYFQKTNLTLAGVVLLSFPVILFFICTQKEFVKGAMSSGIKA